MSPTARKLRFLLVVLAASFVGFGGAFLSVRAAQEKSSAEAQSPVTFERSVVRVVKAGSADTLTFDVEVARTTKQKARGLMFREVIPQGTGMLFLLGQPQITSFWMKNTLVPLDLLFVREDGQIESVIDRAKPHDLTYLVSGGPVTSVLEIGGGEAQRLGIKAGDSLRFSVKEIPHT